MYESDSAANHQNKMCKLSNDKVRELNQDHMRGSRDMQEKMSQCVKCHRDRWAVESQSRDIWTFVTAARRISDHGWFP